MKYFKFSIKKILLSLVVLSLTAGYLCAQQRERIPIHDPVMIEHNGTYYVFATGKGITVWSSPDMEHWIHEEPVFDTAPEWTFNLIPEFNNVIWAPDIAKHNGIYYLYYSVSQFGRNNSAIGVATNETLNPDAPNYKWVDHGPVVRSVPGRDMWNAIDPNLAFDDDGTPWLAFGSFWTGLKIVKLQPNLTEIAQSTESWYTIASRYRYWKLNPRDAGDAANPELNYEKLYPDSVIQASKNMAYGAIEAPFIFKKNGYYYLLASWDRCCRGLESTYKVVVGRSKHIIGPYVDIKGKKMVHGGGTIIARGNEEWAAVGHPAAYTFHGTDYLVFHGYDISDEGRSKLIIKKIKWKNGWPEIKL